MAELTEGYVSGPDAATEPRRRALDAIATADKVVLVEGVTDQIALETLADRLEVDLAGHGVVVAPMGGAHAIDTFLRVLSRRTGPPPDLSGLCDRREAPVVLAALQRAGLGAVGSGDAMERLGFFVCDADLEDELIRALGAERLTEIVAELGDLRPYRTLQRQSEWCGRPATEQLHRFLRSKARRMHRYSRRLVEAAVEIDRVPRPLLGALGIVRTR